MAFPAIDPLFEKGFDLGVSEAERSASLFNTQVTSVRTRVDSSGVPDRVASLAANRIAVLVACCDEETTKPLSVACAKSRVVLFNCGSRSDELRRASCNASTFHIEASNAMYSAARSLAPTANEIVLWNSKLERFGAAQLNDRFKSFAGKEMNGAAWAGWIAVKVAMEAFLRGSGNISKWIAGDTAQFDGHKGAPLSFRSWDGQLRQPLYAVAERITDVPDASRSGRPAREILDTIGDRKGQQSCERAG